MEQIAENNNNQITMHISVYHNSTFCAESGTFCSQTGEFVPPKEQFYPSLINYYYRIVATCPAAAGLSHYRINYLTY